MSRADFLLGVVSGVLLGGLNGFLGFQGEFVKLHLSLLRADEPQVITGESTGYIAEGYLISLRK
jgi:hypothetical protein